MREEYFMTDDLKAQAIALYDRFTHEGLERREFMTRMVAIAGSVAAAEALIGGIAAAPAAAAIVPADDRRLTIRTQTIAGTNSYVAEPRSRSLKPTIIVIASWYLSHRYRTGAPGTLPADHAIDDYVSRAVPYVLAGFAFESDFIAVRP